MGNMAAPGKLLGMARRYDIRVTEKLNIKGVTRKASILSVGFGTLMLPTKTIKPSQRCPQCGAGHKAWADMSVLLVGLRFHKTVVR
jgi:hypothetical protein